MNTIVINNATYRAEPGERLLDTARKHHVHIGYFCGGNGLCQTCYVKVTEGMENLSPLSEREKAMLSQHLIDEGIRVACLTTIDKPGTIKLVTTVEEVRIMVLEHPWEILPYQATMGWESLVKLPDTIAMQAGRFFEGKFDGAEVLQDVVHAITDGIDLLFRAFAPPEQPATVNRVKSRPEVDRQETGRPHFERLMETSRAQLLEEHSLTPIN